MARQIKIDKPADPPPDDGEELSFESDDGEGDTKASPYQERRGEEIVGIIKGIVSLSPRRLYEALERSLTIGSRDISVLYRALDDEDTHVFEAGQLAMIARLEVARYEQTVLPRIEADLREHALTSMPRTMTADGKKEKKPTNSEIEDWIIKTTGPKLGQARLKLAELKAFAGLTEGMATRRSFRPKTIESLLDAARATGTGKTSGYGGDNDN